MKTKVEEETKMEAHVKVGRDSEIEEKIKVETMYRFIPNFMHPFARFISSRPILIDRRIHFDGSARNKWE